MPRKKQIKLDEVRTLPNVFNSAQENCGTLIKGHFSAGCKYTLELGCGNGDYTTALAEHFPDKNFIGVDIKGNRIWTGAKNSIEAGLNNCAFLISNIASIGDVFDEQSIEEIWITFPDPFPRRNGIKKRLVHPRFIEIYNKILIPGGKVNLKTDDESLYNYALEIAGELKLSVNKFTSNLYDGTPLTFEQQIKTKYEKNHLKEGKTIKLVSFSIPAKV